MRFMRVCTETLMVASAAVLLQTERVLRLQTGYFALGRRREDEEQDRREDDRDDPEPTGAEHVTRRSQYDSQELEYEIHEEER